MHAKQEEFDVVSSHDEITRILKVAVTLNIEVYCELPDEVTPTVVELDIRGVSGTQVVFGPKREPGSPGVLLNSVFPNGLKVGSRVEVIFGLIDGQYAIHDVVVDVSMTTFTVSAGRNLLRLQRRKDFRVSVRTDGLLFAQKTGGPSTDPAKEFALLDLSAGGLRLLWPTAAAPVPEIGTVLSGTIKLSAEKTANVEMKMVKSNGVDDPQKPDRGYSLSFQFVNLAQEDARAILFTCLLIHRAHYGTR